VRELSEEEKLKKQQKERISKEYMAALKKEESSFRLKLELIKEIAIKILHDLKQRADTTYEEMKNSIDDRFKKEIKSIKDLCTYIKYCIENKSKIKYDLVLQQDEFLIDNVIFLLKFLYVIF
jgi:hypothetical protein